MPPIHIALGRGRHASRTTRRVADSHSTESCGLSSGGATKIDEDEGPRAETGLEAEREAGESRGGSTRGSKCRFY
jgi:hypothetical protein